MELVYKLRIAGQTAPILRGHTRERRVKVYNQSGHVVSEIDSTALAVKLHERIGIEFDVHPGRRELMRKCRCGRVFMLPPKRSGRSIGRLRKRCQVCIDKSKKCKICGAPSTPSSMKHAVPESAFCAKHIPTGPGCKKETPPCVVCGRPAHSPAKARYAHSIGKAVYCEKHRGGPKNGNDTSTCEVCGAVNSKGHRFCFKHKHTGAIKAKIPCAVCGGPTEYTYESKKCRRYCANHKGGVGLGQFVKGQKPPASSTCKNARKKAWDTRRRKQAGTSS